VQRREETQKKWVYPTCFEFFLHLTNKCLGENPSIQFDMPLSLSAGSCLGTMPPRQKTSHPILSEILMIAFFPAVSQSYATMKFSTPKTSSIISASSDKLVPRVDHAVSLLFFLVGWDFFTMCLNFYFNRGIP
jgi:hypothetical protein